MTVYVVVDNDVTNPQAYRDYLKLITPTVGEFGGRYLIRAGEIHFSDSDWKPDRLVVMAFDKRADAEAWVHSTKTAPIHEMRRANAVSRLIIIDGVDEKEPNLLI